jgi:uncharacterized protein YndB with AHSA1/START domain
MNGIAEANARPQHKIERTYQATLDEVWELWTTKDGIESWWGPEGFAVAVRVLDLRPGGTLRYILTATGAGQIAYMQKAGMPLATEVKLGFTEVLPLRRIRYVTTVDFVAGVQPYEVATLVEFFPVAEGVRMVLTIDAMHDESWTGRARQGWHSQLGKLDAIIGASRRA